MHGQAANITARKLERLYRESVRRDQHVLAIQLDRRGIGQHVEFVSAQVPREHLFDKFTHESAAVTVRQ